MCMYFIIVSYAVFNVDFFSKHLYVSMRYFEMGDKERCLKATGAGMVFWEGGGKWQNFHLRPDIRGCLAKRKGPALVGCQLPQHTAHGLPALASQRGKLEGMVYLFFCCVGCSYAPEFGITTSQSLSSFTF